MNLGTLIYTYFKCKFVGKDEFGNKYYESKEKNPYGQFKRIVNYNGIVEPSKVPPLWNGWLRHNIKDAPTNSNSYTWQKEYKPNLTGTTHKYEPCKSIVKEDNYYTSWKP